MKKRLRATTKLMIRRSIDSALMPTGEWIQTTLGDAKRNNDFTTSCGTMNVSYELHPDEYKNFEGCEAVIYGDHIGFYLNVVESPVDQTVYENGQRVLYTTSHPNHPYDLVRVAQS